MPNVNSQQQQPAPKPQTSGRELDHLRNLLYGVVFVLALALGGLFTNYLANKQATYQNLVNQVIEQNFKIDILVGEIKELKEIKPNFHQ